VELLLTNFLKCTRVKVSGGFEKAPAEKQVQDKKPDPISNGTVTEIGTGASVGKTSGVCRIYGAGDPD
jgi:hypothetical protein